MYKFFKKFIKILRDYEAEIVILELDRESEFPPSLERYTWGVGIDR